MHWQAAIIGLLVSCTQALAKEDFVCPPNAPDDEIILFPHETNCSRFYQCSHGNKILHECPAGLHFNPNANQCDWPNNSACQDRSKRSTDLECPLENQPQDVLLPHETDCGKFYKCDRGQKVVQDCPEGLHFNHEEEYCDWPSNVKCVDVETLVSLLSGARLLGYTKDGCPPTNEDDEIILLPHETNCSRFYECDFGRKALFECPEGLRFNPISSECGWPEDVECELEILV